MPRYSSSFMIAMLCSFWCLMRQLQFYSCIEKKTWFFSEAKCYAHSSHYHFRFQFIECGHVIILGARANLVILVKERAIIDLNRYTHIVGNKKLPHRPHHMLIILIWLCSECRFNMFSVCHEQSLLLVSLQTDKVEVFNSTIIIIQR